MCRFRVTDNTWKLKVVKSDQEKTLETQMRHSEEARGLWSLGTEKDKINQQKGKVPADSCWSSLSFSLFSENIFHHINLSYTLCQQLLSSGPLFISPRRLSS